MMQTSTLKISKQITSICKRNFGNSVPALQKAVDPIQQLFVDKIREYKSKSSGGKLVEPSPELEKELKNDKERVFKQFGGKPGVDLTQFPSFKFTDPKLEVPRAEIPKE